MHVSTVMGSPAGSTKYHKALWHSVLLHIVLLQVVFQGTVEQVLCEHKAVLLHGMDMSSALETQPAFAQDRDCCAAENSLSKGGDKDTKNAPFFFAAWIMGSALESDRCATCRVNPGAAGVLSSSSSLIRSLMALYSIDGGLLASQVACFVGSASSPEHSPCKQEGWTRQRVSLCKQSAWVVGSLNEAQRVYDRDCSYHQERGQTL